MPTKTTTPNPEPPTEAALLRIREVAAETGLTPRSIRYYEEMGLLEPAARSEGAYRLYDPSDLERLRFIKELRDEAGFSLAQIGQLLEDEVARERNRERLRTTQDPSERRAILEDARARVDRQIATLEAKAERLDSMIAAARARRAHLDGHLDELAGGQTPHLDELAGGQTPHLDELAGGPTQHSDKRAGGQTPHSDKRAGS